MTHDWAATHTDDDTIPAGHPPPSPSSLDDIGIAHTIDGDGDSLCRPHLQREQIDDHYWSEVPSDQRCLICAATLDFSSP